MAQLLLCGTLPLPPGAGRVYLCGAMRPRSEIKRLAEAVRLAEAELDAARTRSTLNAAAKRLMNARAALKQPAGEAARRHSPRAIPWARAAGAS